ncbi:hypothetical protein [Butyrivibrio sp. YAB3001]|nr:hypothetical protein [Butyrivibrio sp. YAB3001]SFB82187.1 hypothetical protein SAMN02910398_00746 [Butyrivibrio sp. YAB3001]
MSDLKIYIGIAFTVIGFILFIYDGVTIKRRREKKKMEIEQEYK